MVYFESSAKTRFNVENVFFTAVRECRKMRRPTVATKSSSIGFFGKLFGKKKETKEEEEEEEEKIVGKNVRMPLADTNALVLKLGDLAEVWLKQNKKKEFFLFLFFYFLLGTWVCNWRSLFLLKQLWCIFERSQQC
jgi:hypothetical protein